MKVELENEVILINFFKKIDMILQYKTILSAWSNEFKANACTNPFKVALLQFNAFPLGLEHLLEQVTSNIYLLEIRKNN